MKMLSLYSAFRKRVDHIQIDDYTIEDIEIEFNDFGYDDISGLLGLDLLMNAGFSIDLLNLQLDRNI
jgi:hypothetical protein